MAKTKEELVKKIYELEQKNRDIMDALGEAAEDCLCLIPDTMGDYVAKVIISAFVKEIAEYVGIDISLVN